MNWKYSKSADSKEYFSNDFVNEFKDILDVRSYLESKEVKSKNRANSQSDRMEARIERLNESGDILEGIFEEFERYFKWTGLLKNEVGPSVSDYVLSVIDYLDLNLDLGAEEIESRWKKRNKSTNPSSNIESFWGGFVPKID